MESFLKKSQQNKFVKRETQVRTDLIKHTQISSFKRWEKINIKTRIIILKENPYHLQENKNKRIITNLECLNQEG